MRVARIYILKTTSGKTEPCGKTEWLPWYRARNYKGDLTEAEKRQFDAFRAQPKHPAILCSSLPQEVQDYVNQIELELYDAKQQSRAGAPFLWSLIIVALFVLGYTGYRVPTPTIWSSAVGALTLAGVWFAYSRQFKNAADEFLPKGQDVPDPTDEAIRRAWELNYLVHERSRVRQDTEDDGRAAH